LNKRVQRGTQDYLKSENNTTTEEGNDRGTRKLDWKRLRGKANAEKEMEKARGKKTGKALTPSKKKTRRGGERA